MENLETRKEMDRGLFLLEEGRPLLEKLPADRWDQIFAGLYVVLGILMWNCLCMENFARGLSMFSILYVITVLAYARLKKLSITGEKIFWTLILLGISLPYGFYTVFGFGQTLMIFLVAAYWTLVITEGLLWKGATSSWVLLDSWNGLIALPILNSLCQIRLLFQSFSEKKEEKRDWRMVLLGIIISIPALLIIVPILSQADTGFRNLVSAILDLLGADFRILIWRGIVGILLGALMFGTLYGGAYKRHVKEEECIHFHEESGRVFRFVPDIAVLTFGVIVSAVYLLFIGLQARYLFSAFFGILPEAYGKRDPGGFDPSPFVHGSQQAGYVYSRLWIYCKEVYFLCIFDLAYPGLYPGSDLSEEKHSSGAPGCLCRSSIIYAFVCPACRADYRLDSL